jgi:hypothetical protein
MPAAYGGHRAFRSNLFAAQKVFPLQSLARAAVGNEHNYFVSIVQILLLPLLLFVQREPVLFYCFHI